MSYNDYKLKNLDWVIVKQKQNLHLQYILRYGKHLQLCGPNKL